MFASLPSRVALITLTALTLAACGDNNENNAPSNNTTSATNNSTGATNNTTGGTNNATNGTNNATSATNNATGGTNNATNGTNNTTGGCDEAAKRAEVFGINEAVAEATATFEEADGVSTATIDASVGGVASAPGSSFVYIDLSGAAGPARLEIGDVAALTDDQWDIAFKRTEIRVNSGDSGPGAWLLATAQGDWDTAEPPGPGTPNAWQTDEFISETCALITYGQNTPQTAFAQWYSYDPATHAVGVPEGVTYFLYNMTTHAAFRFQITGYDGGTYQVRWAALGGP